MSAATEAALAGLYETILSPDIWPIALHNLARSIDAVGAVVYPPFTDALADTHLIVPASSDLREPLAAFVAEGWWMDDHRAARARPLMERGRRVIFEHNVASEFDRATMPVYHEFYRRFDVPWFAALSFQAAGLSWAATFLRSESQGPFGRPDEKTLLEFQSHVQRIVRLATRIAIIAGSAVVDLLDRLDVGAALLDRNGMIIQANGSAERIFGTGIDVARGRLTAADSLAAAELQRLVESASALPFPLTAARPVTVPRAGRRPVVVEAVPMSQDRISDPFGILRALVLLTDLGAARGPLEDRLRAVFRLTNAEARLAARLARGEDLGTAGEALGVTSQTARSQLKLIFAKTETHRQGELVALLSRLGGGFRLEAGKP